jgi:hypothetical protein
MAHSASRGARLVSLLLRTAAILAPLAPDLGYWNRHLVGVISALGTLCILLAVDRSHSLAGTRNCMNENPYESPVVQSSESVSKADPFATSDSRICSVLASVVAAIAIATPIPPLLEMASYPPGTAMRPMSAVAAVVFSSLGGLSLAVPLAAWGLIASRRLARQNWFGYFAMLLALSAVVAMPVVLNVIISSRGYVMKE